MHTFMHRGAVMRGNMPYPGIHSMLQKSEHSKKRKSKRTRTLGGGSSDLDDNCTLTEYRCCVSCEEPDLESEMFRIEMGLVCIACFTFKA